jgi:integrase
MKRDGYKFQERWDSWKKNKTIKGVRKEDLDLLKKFLNDMELGLNTPKGMKGKRTAGTLLNLGEHNLFFLKNFSKSILKITKEDLHKLEQKIETGKILKRNGQPFSAFGNYIKDFKVFWHWLQRTKKVKEDATEDISSKTKKPSWVYLTEEQAKSFFNKLIFDYRVLCWLMYDSGMRVTEANSIKISNFSKDFTQLDIPDEVAKTFGRTINLKLCSSLVKEYVKEHKLKPTDYFIQKDLWTINKYLKTNCAKMFGKDKVSHPKARGLYGNYTLYDTRHNSCVFWFNRYPTHKGLMYRFGWRKADKIEYYSEFLGVKDELTDSDMITSEDKTKLEKEIEQLKKAMGEMREKSQTENILIEELMTAIKSGKLKKDDFIDKSGVIQVLVKDKKKILNNPKM